MKNWLKSIVKQFSKIQHELKNKNDGKSYATLRGKICYIDYCKQQGKGNKSKGLEKICCKAKLFDEIQKDHGNVQFNNIVEDFCMENIHAFKENIRLVAPHIADNHLHNFEAAIRVALKTGKWKPEILHSDEEKKGEKNV